MRSAFNWTEVPLGLVWLDLWIPTKQEGIVGRCIYRNFVRRGIHMFQQTRSCAEHQAADTTTATSLEYFCNYWYCILTKSLNLATTIRTRVWNYHGGDMPTSVRAILLHISLLWKTYETGCDKKRLLFIYLCIINICLFLL